MDHRGVPIVLLVALSLALLACQPRAEAPVDPSPSATPEQTGLATASPSPEPTPEWPAEWSLYTSPQYGFSLAHPPEWEICQDTGRSVLFCENRPGVLAFSVLYISVVPYGFRNEQAEAYNFINDETVRRFAALAEGESLAIEGNPTYFTYTRLPDVEIADRSAIVVENQRVWEAGPETRERKLFLLLEEQAYLLGSYYDSPEQLELVRQVLATLRLPE